jgi:4-hydroxy-tetrahydrodipicolinate synthase
MTHKFKGLLVPMLTPFDASGNIDLERAIRFANDLLGSDVGGLALFGTTSEGQSLGVQERMDYLDSLIEGGIPPEKLMVGTGSSALTDAIQMTRHVVHRKCGGVLMLPPYFYKIVSDEGIFRFFVEVVEKVSSPDLRIYLYHIPPIAQVGFSIELIGMLVDRFPSQVVGLKNSSGDHNFTIALRENFPEFDVFCGSENFLLETMKIGGVGCISATGNVNAKEIIKLYNNVDTLRAEKLQMLVSEIRTVVQKHPVIPALKAIISRTYNDPGWSKVRAPLVELPSADADALLEQLERHEFFADQLFIS